jgi:hypothetical protein
MDTTSSLYRPSGCSQHTVKNGHFIEKRLNNSEFQLCRANSLRSESALPYVRTVPTVWFSLLLLSSQRHATRQINLANFTNFRRFLSVGIDGTGAQTLASSSAKCIRACVVKAEHQTVQIMKNIPKNVSEETKSHKHDGDGTVSLPKLQSLLQVVGSRDPKPNSLSRQRKKMKEEVLACRWRLVVSIALIQRKHMNGAVILLVGRHEQPLAGRPERHAMPREHKNINHLQTV